MYPVDAIKVSQTILSPHITGKRPNPHLDPNASGQSVTRSGIHGYFKRCWPNIYAGGHQDIMERHVKRSSWGWYV